MTEKDPLLATTKLGQEKTDGVWPGFWDLSRVRAKYAAGGGFAVYNRCILGQLITVKGD